MKIGVFSDVHSNSVALHAVLEDMPPVDMRVSLGDVVGYGPSPKQAVELVQEHTTTSLYGNHELYLENPEEASSNSGAYSGIQHSREELSPSQLSWASTRPWRAQFETLGIAHGHPDPDTPFEYVGKSNVTRLIPVMRDADYDLLAVGHSHVQFKQDLSKFHDEAGLVFNPGSVGQPRDGDPRAGYAVVDTDTHHVDLHRVEYDVEQVVDAISATGLPAESGERLRTGKYPRSRRRL